MNELIPRATIEDLVRDRDRSIELYRIAFGKIAEASEAMKAADAASQSFKAPVHTDDRLEEIVAFRHAVKLPDADEFMYVAQRLTDIQFWTWIIETGDLQSLMDQEAKDKLHEQLAYQPMKPRRMSGWRNGQTDRDMIDGDEVGRSFPPVTVENVEATIQHFVGQSGFIFRRGIANAFSKLDRRFRSHDGFKIGSRVILTGVCSERGGYAYGRIGHTLTDIERVFTVLDSLNEDGSVREKVSLEGRSFRRAEEAIRQEANLGYGPKQFEVETDYFKIRAYKNGNGHLWMLRPDLVEKVNKLLAEHYGETVGDVRSNDDPLKRPKNALSKDVRDFDLFPTPEAVVKEVIEAAQLGAGYRAKGEPEKLRVLEPSAGLGNLATAAINAGCNVTCVEINPDRARALCNVLSQQVYNCDFLRLSPETTGLFDRVIMNPPFTGERDCDHVNHAIKFLKPGGILVSVMSAGTEFRETKKSIAFRELVEKMQNDRWDRRIFRDLPEGSFKEAGTMVNTTLLTIRKPEELKAEKAA